VAAYALRQQQQTAFREAAAKRRLPVRSVRGNDGRSVLAALPLTLRQRGAELGACSRPVTMIWPAILLVRANLQSLEGFYYARLFPFTINVYTAL
jgi:hypothetical protein